MLTVEAMPAKALHQGARMAKDLACFVNTTKGVGTQLTSATKFMDILATPITTDQVEEVDLTRLPLTLGENVKDSLRISQAHHQHHHQVCCLD